jgi:lipopolysaccharide export system protein LptA
MIPRSMRARRYSFLFIFLGAALVAFAQNLDADQPVSVAETDLFLSNHFGELPDSVVLTYAYAKAGSLEASREDSVRVSVSLGVAGATRQVRVDYLTGAQRFELPPVSAAGGNPVILFFLERDVREMQRLTGGQASYFRKRVRMALADTAEVHPVTFELGGRSVAGEQITIHPYHDDPLRNQFERLAEKAYTFTLSEQVPGRVYRIQIVVNAPGASAEAQPLITETLTLLGAEP